MMAGTGDQVGHSLKLCYLTCACAAKQHVQPSPPHTVQVQDPGLLPPVPEKHAIHPMNPAYQMVPAAGATQMMMVPLVRN
jgi:hypothetical protein